MAWNWQHSDWPKFEWDSGQLYRTESLFLQEAGMAIGAVKHLQSTVQQTLTVELLTNDALDTSQIEGEYLDRESVQSSIRRQLGLAVNKRTARPAEAGIVSIFLNTA